MLQVKDVTIATDKDGYLKHLSDWNEDVALALARSENISLTPEHWEIINLLQDFYREFQLSPAMRALVKRTAQIYGGEKGRSVHLQKLFPPSPARIASKIAGLPRPANCM